MAVVVPVLGFGITSSIIAYNASTSVGLIREDVGDLKIDVREIRATQLEILRNGKGGE
jgi:hypothetical protein